MRAFDHFSTWLTRSLMRENVNRKSLFQRNKHVTGNAWLTDRIWAVDDCAERWLRAVSCYHLLSTDPPPPLCNGRCSGLRDNGRSRGHEYVSIRTAHVGWKFREGAG
jgi:hypothetical protein